MEIAIDCRIAIVCVPKLLSPVATVPSSRHEYNSILFNSIQLFLLLRFGTIIYNSNQLTSFSPSYLWTTAPYLNGCHLIFTFTLLPGVQFYFECFDINIACHHDYLHTSFPCHLSVSGHRLIRPSQTQHMSESAFFSFKRTSNVWLSMPQNSQLI